MRVLAIVESPLQLLCAYEMLCRFRGEYRLILKGSGAERNDSQMEFAAITLGLRYTKVRVRLKHLYIDSLTATIRCAPIMLGSYDYLFLGDYFSRIFRMLAKLPRVNHVYFLDDGVATYQAQQVMQASAKVYSIATFFDAPPLLGQSVIQHSFSELRKRFSLKGSRECIFLGQPLAEKGLTSLDSYVSLVEAAVNSAGGALSYYPHRSESQDTIARVSELPGVHMASTKTCIELHLLISHIYPEKIYGGLSSAMFSLSLIFSKVKIVALIPDSLVRGSSSRIGTIVAALRRLENLEVIETG